MKKTIAILILVFAVHGAAHAQLGGMLKKAKETVKKETEKVIDSSKDKAGQSASNTTTEVKASASAAALPDDVRQAVAKMKDPSLRPPTSWAYAKNADQGGSSFDIEKEKNNPMPLDKMNHHEFASRIYRFSYEELEAIRKQVEDRNADNQSICKALFKPESFSMKDELREHFPGGERIAVEDNLEKEISLYKNYIATLQNYVTQRYTVKKVGDKKFDLMSLPLGLCYLEPAKGKLHFVEYDQFRNQIITPVAPVIYDYERQQLIGIRQLLQRRDDTPQWDEYYFADVVITNMSEGQRNSLANQQKVPVPASQMNNPALKTKMLNLARQAYPSWDIKELIIVESAWRPERNALGQIIHRRINTNIILPNGSGGYTMRTLSFIEPYDGGKYGEVRAFGIGTDNRAVEYKEK